MFSVQKFRRADFSADINRFCNIFMRFQALLIDAVLGLSSAAILGPDLVVRFELKLDAFLGSFWGAFWGSNWVRLWVPKFEHFLIRDFEGRPKMGTQKWTQF